jgi:hypothetical protein
MLCKCTEAAIPKINRQNWNYILAIHLGNKSYLPISSIPEVYWMITTGACKDTGGWVCETTKHLTFIS